MNRLIKKDLIEKVYSGRPGCCCGCRGKHTANKGTISRVVNTMNEQIKAVQESNMYRHIAMLHLPERTYVAYYKEKL